MENYFIDFEPVGRRGTCTGNKSFLDIARELGVGIASLCDGRGNCHSCRIQIISGQATPVSPGELSFFSQVELDRGWRLACQAFPLQDCKVYLPPESMTTIQRTQVEGIEIPVKPEPIVQSYRIKLTPPSLSDSEADSDRLLAILDREYKLECDTIDLSVLQKIPLLLRQNDWVCQVFVRGNEVVHVGPPGAAFLGYALDIGTTKIAGYLINLESGETLTRQAIMNPQISYGEDIVTRMVRASSSPDEAQRLHLLLIDEINRLAENLCQEAGFNAGHIADSVMVGNTAIHHLLLGLPVRQLSLAPYVAAIRKEIDVKARDLNFNFAPGSYVHIPANIAGFVGADHTADLLAVDALRVRDTVILIDIGTNTEISLVHQGKITSVSCASGPAFEGGHIRFGMRASAGAIERLRIENGKIEYKTVADTPPSGICGSGILDSLSEMFRHGIVDENGRILKNNNFVTETADGQREFIIVGSEKPISITQKDVRELQLAKAAIRSGIQILLENSRITENDIDRVIIAGAFGTYIDIASAINIGMLPPLPRERFSQIGNSAGMGAKLALISRPKREEARDIARQTRYIELAAAPNFMKTFSQACYLGQYQIKDGKRIPVVNLATGI